MTHLRKTFSAGISVVFLLAVSVLFLLSCSRPNDKNSNLPVVFAGVPIRALQVEGISNQLEQAVFRAPSGERRVLKKGDLVGEEQFEVSAIGGDRVVLREAGRYRPIIGEPKTMIISFDPSKAPGERQRMVTIAGPRMAVKNQIVFPNGHRAGRPEQIRNDGE